MGRSVSSTHTTAEGLTRVTQSTACIRGLTLLAHQNGATASMARNNGGVLDAASSPRPYTSAVPKIEYPGEFRRRNGLYCQHCSLNEIDSV